MTRGLHETIVDPLGTPLIIDGKVARKAEISYETAEGMDADAELDFPLRGHSFNPLVDVAQPLLALALRIRRINGPMDAKALHERTRNQMLSMENELRLQGYDAGTLSAYRYCLCSFLDEAMMATQWGSQSEWAQHSLLSACHNETWGGEKFFSILSRLMTQPEHFRDLLEFLYLCLCLGFKGRYQLERDGQDSLNRIMRGLHRTLRDRRGAAPATLTAVQDQPVSGQGRAVRFLPVFTPWIAAALLMAGAYCAYAFHLDAKTQDVLQALDSVLQPPG